MTDTLPAYAACAKRTPVRGRLRQTRERVYHKMRAIEDDIRDHREFIALLHDLPTDPAPESFWRRVLDFLRRALP